MYIASLCSSWNISFNGISSFGEQTFQLDQSGMKHILQRHHPDFWNGSIRDKQAFLNPRMTIEQVSEAVHEIMKQNRDVLIQRGTNEGYQMRGTYLGQEYVVMATAEYDEFMTVMCEEGKRFFRKMIQLVPNHQKMYEQEITCLEAAMTYAKQH